MTSRTALRRGSHIETHQAQGAAAHGKVLDRLEEQSGRCSAFGRLKSHYVRNPTLRPAFGFFIGRRGFPLLECYYSAEERENFKSVSPSEAVMDGSRNERARARAQHLLAQIAPLPDDSELQSLRELSLNYIREAERLEGEPGTRVEPSEQIS